MAHHNHAKGDFIYRQGEPAQNLYIVYRGKVRRILLLFPVHMFLSSANVQEEEELDR